MDLKRYFLINQQDLSRDAAHSMLLQVRRSTNADTPRLSEVSADGLYFASTMSMGQLILFHELLTRYGIAFTVLTERPKLKAARPTVRDATPEEAKAVETIQDSLNKLFGAVDKLLGGLDKPK